MRAIGAPDIAVSPASLNFGPVIVGADKILNVAVTNAGDDTLYVSGVSSSHGDFTASPVTFNLAPDGTGDFRGSVGDDVVQCLLEGGCHGLHGSIDRPD